MELNGIVILTFTKDNGLRKITFDDLIKQIYFLSRSKRCLDFDHYIISKCVIGYF